ncbi:MAG: hypothetical protein IMW89_13330 [Ktedonobacteraceae bacterium]|nr:hypothetical protein [Ktedonobacteraceae bacterium]
MLQTLPLVLFIILAEVSIGSVCVLVFLDWRNEVKRGFLISYALIYLGLAGLTYLVQQNFATPALLNTFARLDKTWTGYQSLPLLLFFLLLIPYSLFILLDRHAGVDGKERAEKEDAGEKGSRFSVLRILRLASGGGTVLAGLVTLFVMAMTYRFLGGAGLGEIMTVPGFFAAAFALGGVMTAMWLGHWYLVTPALSEKPLLFSTTLVLLAIVAQVIFTVLSGQIFVSASQPSVSPGSTTVATPVPGPAAPGSQIKPAGAPVVTPLGADVVGWLHLVVGFALPLVLGVLAWKLVRDRSFQSATGMLYLIVVLTLAGEIMARGLFLARI